MMLFVCDCCKKPIKDQKNSSGQGLAQNQLVNQPVAIGQISSPPVSKTVYYFNYESPQDSEHTNQLCETCSKEWNDLLEKFLSSKQKDYMFLYKED